ncbi:hypothetical protein GCM10027020_32850 [Nocardioides salsibiostraticola]
MTSDLADLILILLIALPALIGAGLTLGGIALDRSAAPLALVTAAAGLIGSVVAALARPQVSSRFMAGADLTLAVDGLAALMILTIGVVLVLVLAFAVGDIDESRARFFGLMLIFAAAALLTAVAATLPALLIGWEVMGATSYALIGFHWRETRRVSSGLTAFTTTRAADLGLYIAAGAALAGGAGLALDDLAAATPGWRSVIAAGVVVAALGKAAQLPFSFWLARAMDGPSPVSALLHSAAMVALGGYLLLRVSPLLQATSWAGPTVAWIGALTAVVLGVVALTQSDLKLLLAASTSAQLGFVVLAAGVGAVAGGAAHLVAHAAVKALLFLVAGAWLAHLGTKTLSDLRGAARIWPTVGVTASVGLVSLAGIAPLALWATKDSVLAAALKESPALYLVGLVGAGLSAAYAGKVLVIIWRPRERTDLEPLPRWLTAPLWPLAAGAVVLGALALPPLAEPVRELVGAEGAVEPAAWELIVSALLGVAVLAATWRLAGRRVVSAPAFDWARDWFRLEPLVHRVVVKPTMSLARVAARWDDRGLDRVPAAVAAGTLALSRSVDALDDRILDGSVEGLSRGTTRLADGSATADRVGIDGAVESLAALVRKAGRLARRPQTGQLHQYYLQAVGALLAVVLVLVPVLLVVR